MTEPVSVSVILPTFNERGSMQQLIPRLEQVLSRYDHELIVVDDASADGTAELVEDLDHGIPLVLISPVGPPRARARPCSTGSRGAELPWWPSWTRMGAILRGSFRRSSIRWSAARRRW